jgi:hypothetical protein
LNELASITKWVSGGSNVKESFLWTCPVCGRGATVTEANRDHDFVPLRTENTDGPRAAVSVFIVCPNPECRRYSLYVLLCEAVPTNTYKGATQIYELATGLEPLHSWQLVPASAAKTFPDYVPAPIREDYTQASLIQEISPKASATLARRCLQGMIRDFYGIKKARLKDEIEAIQDRVDPLTWQAIDAVRSVGNIGAHMEKDINVIVEVEPGEAAMLVGLVERLIQDWYVVHHEKEEHLNEIIALKDAKERARRPG